MPIICRNQGHTNDPYPDLWVRARKYLNEKHPKLKGIPVSRDTLIALLLEEVGY
jgi:hypothetical protein